MSLIKLVDNFNNYYNANMYKLTINYNIFDTAIEILGFK